MRVFAEKGGAIPENVWSIPENRPSIPENHRLIPEIPATIPENPDTIPEFSTFLLHKKSYPKQDSFFISTLLAAFHFHRDAVPG